MEGNRVGDDEPVEDDDLQAAESGDGLRWRTMTLGTNRRWGRHGWSDGGPAQWRNGRVGPIRRHLMKPATRVESWLWTVMGRPVEVAGHIRTPTGTVRWDVAAAEGWLAVRLPGLPVRFSDLGDIPARGTTQVSGSDRHNRLFCVLALSDDPAGREADDQPVTGDRVVVDTEFRLKSIRLRILGIVVTGRPIDELYEEPPAHVAGWHRVHALDSGDLWVGVFSTNDVG